MHADTALNVNAELMSSFTLWSLHLPNTHTVRLVSHIHSPSWAGTTLIRGSFHK